MTWVQVADGQAVNHNGQQLEAGSRIDVDDNLAAKWLERQLVMPAKAPVKKATAKKAATPVAKAAVKVSPKK